MHEYNFSLTDDVYMVTDWDTYIRRRLRSSCRQIQDAARPKAVHLHHSTFPLGENTRGRISERSGNVEGPGALLTLKQIFFGAMRRSVPVSSLEKSNSIPVA